MNDDEGRPFNVETDSRWNREPGIAVVPGSNYQKEMARFEQFPYAKWAFGNPGNPYTYRPYPKMLYKAERFQGKPACMAAPPDEYEFKDVREFQRATEAAARFTEKCQMTVASEEERSRAWEGGWRDSPAEAVEALLARDRAISEATAHRNYEDRNMGEPAKREIAATQNEVGGEHVPEIAEKPRQKRKYVRKAQPAV